MDRIDTLVTQNRESVNKLFLNVMHNELLTLNERILVATEANLGGFAQYISFPVAIDWNTHIQYFSENAPRYSAVSYYNFIKFMRKESDNVSYEGPTIEDLEEEIFKYMLETGYIGFINDW